MEIEDIRMKKGYAVIFLRRYWNNEKTRQNAENKQTLDLSGKIEIEGKTRQNAGNKQTFDFTRKIEIEGKTRQNAENKQTLVFSWSIFQIILTSSIYIFG